MKKSGPATNRKSGIHRDSGREISGVSTGVSKKNIVT